MRTTVEVFAEITCPFAYVGLQHVIEHVAELEEPVGVIVHAWPLEWVNGTGLAYEGVETKAKALREQLDLDVFNGLHAIAWPSTTIPALALASAAYDIDVPTGLAVSTDLRTAVFEFGVDIGDPDALVEIARAHGVAFDPTDVAGHERAVRSEYEDGQRRGVKGSPHYFVAADDFFCPALDLGRDADDHLIARFDPDGLARFLDRVQL